MEAGGPSGLSILFDALAAVLEAFVSRVEGGIQAQGKQKPPSPHSPRQTFKSGSATTGPVFPVCLKDALPNSSVSEDDSTQEKALITLVQETLKNEDTSAAAEEVVVTFGTRERFFSAQVFRFFLTH